MIRQEIIREIKKSEEITSETMSCKFIKSRIWSRFINSRFQKINILLFEITKVHRRDHIERSINFSTQESHVRKTYGYENIQSVKYFAEIPVHNNDVHIDRKIYVPKTATE